MQTQAKTRKYKEKIGGCPLLSAEIDRAIRDAIRLTDAKEQPKDEGSLSLRQILRTLELAGFEAKDEKWFLWNAIRDTGFRGFGQHERGFYLLLGCVDSEQDETSYIDDLRVLIYRIEKKSKEVEKELAELLKYKDQQENEANRPVDRYRSRDLFPENVRGIMIRGRSSMEAEIRERRERLQLFDNIYIGFLNSTSKSIENLIDAVRREIAPHPKFKLADYGDRKLICDGLKVDFVVQGEIEDS